MGYASWTIYGFDSNGSNRQKALRIIVRRPDGESALG
jgi:ribulose bisphosphate carboxylase small subunit